MHTSSNAKVTLFPARSLSCLLALLLLFTARPVNAEERDVYVLRSDGVAVLFSIEIADTEAERAQGLMHRATLRSRSGMLFDFGREIGIRMWMKNTLIPLDMLFAADDGTIRHIAADTVPYSESLISSPEPARYVLEINGGEARRLGLQPGDSLLLPLR